MLFLVRILDAGQHQGMTTCTRQDGALKDARLVGANRHDQVLLPARNAAVRLAQYMVDGGSQRLKQADLYVQIAAAMVVQHDAGEQVCTMGWRHERHVSIYECLAAEAAHLAFTSLVSTEPPSRSLAITSLFCRARS